jgi:lysophospholipase L1-like esterase
MQNTMKTISVILVALLGQLVAMAGEPRVAIFGDSITYSGRWPALVESALRTAPAFTEAEIVNFGLASETVSGLSEPDHADGKFPRPDLHERIGRILDAFKPTHVLACYGMNDGIYMPLDETRQKAFQDGITRLKAEVEKRDAKLVVITAPLYDGDHPATAPQGYDAVLDAQAAWLATQEGWQVIDIRTDLRAAIAAEKQTDPDFVYARDKIHPGEKGHDFIAASVVRQIWPLWHLPGKPALADGKALSILETRAVILKHAWLRKTGLTRPGVPDGLPLEAAQERAAELLRGYHALRSNPESKIPGH